jgi:nucleoside-diphosphate-sugar epimerase
VGTGRFIRINRLWERIGHLAGFNNGPKYEPPRAGDIMESVASIDYAGKTLGFKPEYSFDEGLEETFKYYLTTNEHLELDTDGHR